jgi:hypothetical protein
VSFDPHGLYVDLWHITSIANIRRLPMNQLGVSMLWARTTLESSSTSLPLLLPPSAVVAARTITTMQALLSVQELEPLLPQQLPRKAYISLQRHRDQRNNVVFVVFCYCLFAFLLLKKTNRLLQ